MMASLAQAPSFKPPLALGLFSGLTRPMTMHATPTSPAQTPPAATTSLASQHAQWITLVGQSKDRDAFVGLFEYFAPRIKSYLLKNGADEATAEEAVQNTFVTIWEKAASFNPAKAAASTWVFTIARNKRIDALRRQKFVVELDDDSNLLENTAAETVEDFADSRTIEKLHTAMDTLPPEQAQLVRMAFFEDKSHQAISDETQLPLGTVKSRLRLAVDKLRHILRSERN